MHVPVANAVRVAVDDTAAAAGGTAAVVAADIDVAVVVAVGKIGGCSHCLTRLTFASELWRRRTQRQSESRIESARKGLLRCC